MEQQIIQNRKIGKYMGKWVDFRGKMASIKGGGYGYTRGEKLRKLRGEIVTNYTRGGKWITRRGGGEMV